MLQPDLDRFEALYRLADRLIADSSKEDLAEAVRILALNLAQDQAKYGDLPAQAQHEIRLGGTDAPEMGQPFGRAPRSHLSERVARIRVD